MTDLYRKLANRRNRVLFVIAAVLLCVTAPAVVEAAGPNILDGEQVPADWRLGSLKDLNGYFPFSPAKTTGDWERRAQRLRRQMLVSFGLWPMPTKTPLNPVIHGRVDRDDYTVERVFFESYPGFYVTGNLYRPKGKTGRLPGILCPHGHWTNGRFYDNSSGIKNEIAQGAERYEEGGRSPLQSRCVKLARMGCVVFHYDMIGYADSVQITRDLAHGFAKQRPEMNSPENWGLFSPQAESNLQSIMGMQTYSSIRALDFIEQLPDVDPARIAVTGSSGGGTQTFVICALDSRPAVAVPAVMVSTAMQGGCTCENCSALRVETGNVEMAALIAPRPMLLTAADDWTKEMPTKGFPELRQHYQMMGVPNLLALSAPLQFGHNYNYVNRAAMYDWMNKYLDLKQATPIVEQDYKRLSREEMTVWNDEHKRPEGGPDFERRLVRWMKSDADKQIASLAPRDSESMAEYKRIVGGAVDVLIGRSLSDVGSVEYDQTVKNDKGDYLEMAGLLRHHVAGGRLEELPIVFLHPKTWQKKVVIWLDESGKAGLYNESGQPIAAVQKLVDAGTCVIGLDMLYQGEFLAGGKAITKTRRVGNPREFAGYTFGYNHTLFARRVHDILSVVSFINRYEQQSDEIAIVGLGEMGPLAAAARAQSGNAIDRAAIDTDGFRFGKIRDLHDRNFLPGGAKYDDVPGLLALAAPAKLWLAGEGNTVPSAVADAYRATSAINNITLHTGKRDNAAVAAWLLDEKK